MNFEDIIDKRTSCRSFSEKKVEKEKIDKILYAGLIAPTAKNIQPQYIYVVNSEEGLSKIDQVTRCRYNASLCLLVCANKDIAYKKEDYSSFEMDGSIVATFMMLEATNLGIDSLWIRLFNSDKVKKEFNLPSHLEPVCILALGYKTEDYTVSPNYHKRKDISEIVEYI